jgi:hypothetical protein
VPYQDRRPARVPNPTPPRKLLVIRPGEQFAGRLRYDTLADGRTRILPTWLLTTSDHDLAARIATVLGGRLQADDVGDERESTYRVLTEYAAIDVLLDGPQAICLRMLRRHGSTVLRCCDGRTQQTPAGERPCHCPPTLKERWRAAKAGHGCEPLVHLAFRLAADPSLGRFLLSSATWTFADRATTAKAALRRRQGPVRARLLIDRALYTTASGTIFAYTRPTITVFPTT